MYNLFNPGNQFDKSPFLYARMAYVQSRVDENYQKLVQARKLSTGRLDSNHLLMKLLISLNVDFTGDIIDYMAKVEVAARSLCGILGIASSASRGRLMTETYFYPKCPEIVVYARNPRWNAMDLWRDWRNVSPIEVVTHPITDLAVIELSVKNEAHVYGGGLAVILIDIPLLAAQWKMWQAAYPGRGMEEYLTTVPLVGAVKSHLNVVMFNKVMDALLLMKNTAVLSNLPFAQTPVNEHANDIVAEVIDKVGSKQMSGNQILSSIPMIYGTNYLETVGLPDMTPTNQVMWALWAQKMDPAALVLRFGKMAGYDRMLHEITVLRRAVIDNDNDKILSNGLTTNARELLQTRFRKDIIEMLPA